MQDIKKIKNQKSKIHLDMGAFYRQLINKWGIKFKRHSKVQKISLFCLKVLLFGLIFSLIVLSVRRNPVIAMMGIIMLLSGAYLFFRKRIKSPDKSIQFSSTKQSATITDNHGDLEVQDAIIMDNNLDLAHLNIQVNSQVNYNQEYVTIKNQRIQLDGNISHFLEHLRDIFEQTIAQSSDPVAAINEFSSDLNQQFDQHPELKSYFSMDLESSPRELVNQIIKFLLSPQSYPLEKIDENGDLVRIEYHDDRDSHINKCIVIYKGYRINLYRNQNNRWVFRIQKRDLSPLELKRQPRRYRKKENAIARAKKHIREDLFKRWLL